jgi:hypothetical protein
MGRPVQQRVEQLTLRAMQQLLQHPQPPMQSGPLFDQQQRIYRHPQTAAYQNVSGASLEGGEEEHTNVQNRL